MDGHHSKQITLSTHRGHVGQAITTPEASANRDIKQHLAQIMTSPARPPRRQHTRESRSLTYDPDRLDHHQRPRRCHQRLVYIINNQTTNRTTHHLRSAFPLEETWDFSNPKNLLQDRHFRASHAVTNPNVMKLRG